MFSVQLNGKEVWGWRRYAAATAGVIAIGLLGYVLISPFALAFFLATN